MTNGIAYNVWYWVTDDIELWYIPLKTGYPGTVNAVFDAFEIYTYKPIDTKPLGDHREAVQPSMQTNDMPHVSLLPEEGKRGKNYTQFTCLALRLPKFQP